ncbi:hypothetical protein GCM10017687_13310 [Streptomyces echinatus]
MDVWRTEDRLMSQVTDDGVGGATSPGAPVLAGLAARLDAWTASLCGDICPRRGPHPA